MFDQLADRLQGTLSGLGGRGKLSEADVDAAMREIRLALLEADVNFKVAKQFVSRIEERVASEAVQKSFTPAQQIIKIVNEELTELLGGTAVPFQLQAGFSAVMVVGLQGSGKTTFCAKLANFLRKKGRKPMLVALDVYRPAAMDQLEILGRQVDIPVSRGKPPTRMSKSFSKRPALKRATKCATR